ncbi:Protein of uncharacterised function (DUF1471) [Proteus vulgaris]|nr:Protein of uncharacterised function (DUF1471) [Proteus vulgaris]
MKLKTSVIAAAMLSLTNITVAQAAQELTPEQAAALKPFERITVIGRFNAIYEAADAVSRRADKVGADSFYIQGLDDISDSGNMTVTADLYHKDAPKAEEESYRVFHGVTELPKPEAILLQPFDTVSIRGYFPTTLILTMQLQKQRLKKVQHHSLLYVTYRQMMVVTKKSQLISTKKMHLNVLFKHQKPLFLTILMPVAHLLQKAEPLPIKLRNQVLHQTLILIEV